MKFKPVKHTLKSGTSVTIRIPRPEEAQKLIDLKLSYIKNTTTLPLTPDEYPNDPNKEGQLIRDYESSPNSILLVAEIDNELIGNIDLTGSVRSKMAHTAMLGMGIQEAWRNQGLGRLLIESVKKWATGHSPLEIICLDVYATNTSGYNLYKNMGFIQSGIIPNFFREENGYRDKIHMYCPIKASNL